MLQSLSNRRGVALKLSIFSFNIRRHIFACRPLILWAKGFVWQLTNSAEYYIFLRDD
jgi:hypothetical protein